MSEGHIELYRRLGWARRRRLNAGSGWELPVPATYVAGRDGVIAYAFADADWAQAGGAGGHRRRRRRRLAQAAETAG